MSCYKNPTGLCKVCGKQTKKTMGLARTRMYCSKECRDSCPELKKKRQNINKGKKQSKEQIAARVRNTDQSAKERKRKDTMVDRYGVSNWMQTEDGKAHISSVHKGTQKPRTKEHQRKIIESKIRNGNTKHSKETIEKISHTLLSHYDREDVDFSYLARRTGNTYVYGYHNDIYYRSSYEKMFLQFCEKYDIAVVSAENTEHMVKYVKNNGRNARYYPDFYLPDFEITVEIKPFSMIEVEDNWNKIEAAMRNKDNYIVLTEADGVTNENLWPHLYAENFEYLCTSG